MLSIKRTLSALLCAVFLSASITAISGLLGTPEAFKRGEVYSGGWDDTDRSAIRRKLADTDLIWEVPEWVDAGKGQTRLLYKDYKKITGKDYEPRAQGNAPSCVGQAVAAAVDFLCHIEIRAGDPERRPPGPAEAGCIYGLSRQEIGELGPKAGGGSHNLWACQAIRQYGVIARLNYPFLGHDLRRPSAERAVKFGALGLPNGLEMIARIHPIQDYISVDSYEECRDCIYMGSPVVVGSSQGFGGGRLTRDSEGFLNPPNRLFFPSVWNHSMCIIAVSDEGRKGCLILNSWGSNWVNGPQRYGDEPEGSFWVDWEIIQKMVSQGDSFAIRGFEGYPSYRLWRP